MQSRTAERIRTAIAAGTYWEADQLLVVYRREVEECWRAASPEEQRVLSREVIDLLRWARHSILAARSHTRSKLVRLTGRSAYAGNSARPANPIELEA
ncbi:MAG: hypothetical protein ABSB35_02520 [Bryobacteraceae bacterium]|jgi:hypothetical protein